MSVPTQIIKKIFGINSPAKIICLKAGDSIIELFEFPKAKGVKPSMGTITHIALSVSNRKETFQKMKNKNTVTVLIDKGDGNFTYFVKDPDGVLIELKD